MANDSSHAQTLLQRLDHWAAENPWHSRCLPFAAYVGLLPVMGSITDKQPYAYPLVYALQCGLVVWLLWRYRHLIPELTLSFHWLSVPVGVGVAVAWIWLGLGMVEASPEWFGTPNPNNQIEQLGLGMGWLSFSMRLLGMALLVPLFEELFIRSLILRSMHRFRKTAIGTLQIIHDLPLLGEWLMHTKVGMKAGRHPPVFGPEFDRTPLGQLSVFGVTSSTVIFTLHHAMRDWPGCVVCALAYCWLLSVTRKKGLGPVCWAHGITNALLWVYTLQTGDWQFL